MNRHPHEPHRRDRGAAAIEYAILAGLIAISVLLGATAIGVSMNGVLTDVANAF